MTPWWADPNLWIAAASLVASLAALAVANLALKRSDRNASGATLVSLYDALRQGWICLRDAQTDEDRDYQFSELMNSFEIAAAIYVDEAIHGRLKEILETYLCHTLSEIGGNDYARARLVATRDTIDTYKNIREFQRQMKSAGKMVPIPEIL